jgi:hypothetical protein
MRDRTNRLNRVMLIVIGTIALLAGVGGVLLGTGVLGARFKHRAVIDGNVSDFVNDREQWLWWTIGGVALLLALLAIYWLVVQLRTERIGSLELPASRDGGNRMSTGALADAVRQEAEQLPGVARARARLVHESEDPQLLLAVAIRTGADLAAVQSALDADVLSHARAAVGRESLRTFLRVEMDTADTPRVL